MQHAYVSSPTNDTVTDRNAEVGIFGQTLSMPSTAGVEPYLYLNVWPKILSHADISIVQCLSIGIWEGDQSVTV